MHQFLRTMAVFLLMQGVLFAILIFAAQRVTDPYISTLRLKHQHLASSPKPRLILVGASGLAFGIQSELLKAEISSHSPANLGLHAALGLDFILADALREVGSGDLVLLCLEYEIWPVLRGTDPFWDGLLCRPGTAPRLNKRWLADDGFGFFGHVTKRGVEALTRTTRNPTPGFFSYKSFNEYGDFIAHRTLPRVRPMTDGDSLSMDPLGCEDEQQLPTVRKFVSACETRGATVVIFFPPVPEPMFERHKADLIRYVENQRAAFGDRVLGRLEDLPTAEDLFFDGVNHLTWEGGARRTRAIIERLKVSGKIRAMTPPGDRQADE